MNTLLRLIFLFGLTAARHVVAAPSGDTKGNEAEISRLDARRIEALVKGDAKTLEQLYSDDLVYVHSAGKIDSKKGYLALIAGGSLNYVSQDYDPPARVVMAGRDTALVNGRATIAVKSKAGQVTKRLLTTTTVYVRSSAGWQVVLYQATPVQP